MAAANRHQISGAALSPKHMRTHNSIHGVGTSAERSDVRGQAMLPLGLVYPEVVVRVREVAADQLHAEVGGGVRRFAQRGRQRVRQHPEHHGHHGRRVLQPGQHDPLGHVRKGVPS